MPGIVLMLGAEGLTMFSLLDADRAAHPGAELGAIRTCAHRPAAIRARPMTALTLFTCTLGGSFNGIRVKKAIAKKPEK